MNFKEALIAHLQGEKVEAKAFKHWEPLVLWVSRGNATLCEALAESNFATACEFRLAPRTITVNGVEVPAPESEAPKRGKTYYIPTPDTEELWSERWDYCEDTTLRHIDRGIVYLNKEDAIARAKAMLLHE